MVDKLHDYQGPVGQLHTIRDNVKSKFTNWKENFNGIDRRMVDKILQKNTEPSLEGSTDSLDYNFIFRRKTRWELTRLCAVVMGIEFAYSAITAFSSPILLEMGVDKKYMTMTFSLSALLGFFLSPLCGSLSDRCTSSFGRRRIFMVTFSIMELFGLFLIPYSHGAYQKFIGEHPPVSNSTEILLLNNSVNVIPFGKEAQILNFSLPKMNELFANGKTSSTPAWIIATSILGIVIADHFADNLQNPSRAYLLDVCNEGDHTRGLSTFTILAGCGGTIGYGLGSIDWDNSFVGQMLGGHIKTVFWLTSVFFLFCVILTITTFKEVPLKLLHKVEQLSKKYYCRKINDNDDSNDSNDDDGDDNNGYAMKLQKIPEVEINEEITGTDLEQNSQNHKEKERQLRSESIKEEAPPLKEYLMSIVNLPYSLKILLLTNVLCWMSHVSYSLYFTDYVGEAIFMGDPGALEHSQSRLNYEEGVRYACRGMSIYSFSCTICSIFMERLIKKCGLRPVYLANISIDIISMFLMFLMNSREAAIVFSFASGILYCTIFTIPYIIVARYHTLNVFEVDSKGNYIHSTQIRGIGTDVAVIGSSVFIAQFFLSLCMGFIINWFGSPHAVPLMCTILSALALVGACNIVYLDM